MIGAVISVGANRESQEGTAPNAAGDAPLRRSPFPVWDLLGSSLLHRFLDQVRDLAKVISVVPEDRTLGSISLPSFATLHHTKTRGFWNIWNAAVQAYVSQGADSLLLVRLGSYAEIDLHDLILCHQQTDSNFTQVFTDKGPIDVILVKATELSKGMGTFRNRLLNLSPQRRRYRFIGYTNALQTVADFRSLTHDALWGKCRVRPCGNQVQPGIWIAANAKVDARARLEAPAYVGQRSRIGAECTITESSVERDCKIDSGTLVRSSNVLPCTYVGPGLTFDNTVVSQQRLFHLGRQLELSIRDPRILRTIRQRLSMAERMRGTLRDSYTKICIPDKSTLAKQNASLKDTKLRGLEVAVPISDFREGLRVPSQARGWEKPSK